MKKADLVEKIAKEQNLDPKKLSRLSIDQLKKMDEVVPDEELSEADILGEEETEETADDQESVSVGVEEEAVDDVVFGGLSPDGVIIDEAANIPDEVFEEVAKRLVGHHPISKEPVYK